MEDRRGVWRKLLEVEYDEMGRVRGRSALLKG